MSDLPNKKWKVYNDPLMPPNKMLLGHKGGSYLDTGYIMSEGAIPWTMPEPTVIERLAGVVDPVIQERVEKMDEDRTKRFIHFDLVTDAAVEGAVPKVIE